MSKLRITGVRVDVVRGPAQNKRRHGAGEEPLDKLVSIADPDVIRTRAGRHETAGDPRDGMGTRRRQDGSFHERWRNRRNRGTAAGIGPAPEPQDAGLPGKI